MRREPLIACAAVGVAVLALAVAPAASATASREPHRGWQPAAPTPATARAASARTSEPAPVAPRLDARLNRAAEQRSGSAEVVLRGAASRLTTAVRGEHGRVLAAAGDAVTAVVPAASLRRLAGRAGVESVGPVVRGYIQAVSEGVHASNADAWQAAGQDGSGVKVAVVDAGFQGLATEVGAGNLPAGLTVAGNHCANVNGTDHGTTVAEIVHQMAPGAQLFLYCIDDNVGFEEAESELQAAGVTVVNSSLAFPGDSRGDGTGPAHSAALTVRTARQNGILWVESAGNNGQDHWPGTFIDADNDTVVDLVNRDSEDDYVGIFDGGGSIILRWDQWPTSTLAVTLHAWQFDDSGHFVGSPVSVTHASGTAPLLCLEYLVFAGDGCGALQGPGNYDVWVTVPTAVLGVHYDLSYWGDVNGNYLSCAAWSGSTCLGPSARAQSGSITEPASSPYALAVGAVGVAPGRCGNDEDIGAAYPLEVFSSQGPTVDRRVKPDIAAFDGVSTNLGSGGFCGTSAAAPHVAGAAALVKAANPSMDAAQIQDFLERRAGISPPTQQVGHGILDLGATTGVAPPHGSGYAPLSRPRRILDTRSGTGGHRGAVGKRATVTVTVPELPADATAVAVNLTAIAQGSTYLAVYPGHSAWPGTSNLNLAEPRDTPAAVFATVPLGAGQTITVRNSSASTDVVIDLLGYFGSNATGKYGAVRGQRILDTRVGTGGHTGRLGPRQSVRVHVPGVPSGSQTTAVVNVTATGESAGGHLALSPDCSHTSSTLNYKKHTTRANLALVRLDASGRLCVYNSYGPLHVIVDLIGYFGASGTAGYVPLTAPVRIADTRTGNGGHHGALAARATLTLRGAGIFDVPYSAGALLTGVTVTAATSSSFVTVYSGSSRPGVSTLNVTPRRTVPNAAVVNLSSAAAEIYHNEGTMQVVVDLFGYFV